MIGTVLLLAGLPLLARRLLGPAGPSRTGRALRVCCYAAFLAYLPAMATTRAFAGLTPAQPAYRRIYCAIEACGMAPRKTAGSLPLAPEIMLLLLIAGYVSVVLVVTSRRSQVSGGTLATGAGIGLLLGIVMYAVAPLGLNHYATNPWLPGSDIDPLVALAWILLLGGPAVAAVLASRRCRGPDGERPSPDVRAAHGAAAGVLATVTGALFVTALGTGTAALLLQSAGVRPWFSPGHPLTAIAAYHAEIYASTDAMGYLLIFFCFPLIGLIVSTMAAACASLAEGGLRSARCDIGPHKTGSPPQRAGWPDATNPPHSP